MTELTSVVDKFGIYIYKSALIFFRAENLDNWRHREGAMLKDPIINAYICKLDEEIFTEDPVMEPDILSEEQIRKEWIEEDWKGLFIEICNMARTHRQCFAVLYDREPYWRVYNDRHIKKIIYDKYGNPATLVVEYDVVYPFSEKATEINETITLNRKGKDSTESANGLFIPFGRGKGNKLGICDLESIWDLDIYTRYQVLDIVNNSAKTKGFFHFVYGDAMKDDQKTDLINALDYTGIGQAIGAKKRVLEDVLFHYPENPEFTIEALNETLSVLAGVTRLPVSFFKGEKSGGGVFQEGFSDEAKITKKKQYIFSQFKKYFIKLIEMRWGKELKNIKPYIEEEIKQENQFEQDQSKQFEQDHFNNDKKNIEDKI